MKNLIFVITLIVTSTNANAEHHATLRAEFEALQFLLGSCWEREFPDGIRTDLHCFESVYDGKHLRDRHVVKGGASLYRGETIYSWSVDANKITYVYWNSLGGVSTGTATPEDGQIAFPDESYIGSNGETVTISSVWENITDDSYDSLIIETFPNGDTNARRVRYQKRSLDCAKTA